MKLSLYDDSMNRIAIIGERFVSCLWSEGYNTTQPFTVELQATSEYKQKIRPDYYIGRDDRKTLMVIKTVTIMDGIITASGSQAGRCLDDVPFIGTIQEGSVIVSSIKSSYDFSDKFPMIEFADSDLTDTYGHQISNKSFLELCQTMCQDSDVGFRTTRKNGGIVAEFYKPEENPNLIFSENYHNLTVNELALSTENWKNYAIVLGEGEGTARTRVDVDQTNGEQKRSLIVDARDLSREEAETDEEYTARLAARGNEKLLECQKTWECAFTPLSGQFGTRFDLGDILTVLLPDYGLKLKARVSRFTQKEQRNQTETTIEVGAITITR